MVEGTGDSGDSDAKEQGWAGDSSADGGGADGEDGKQGTGKEYGKSGEQSEGDAAALKDSTNASDDSAGEDAGDEAHKEGGDEDRGSEDDKDAETPVKKAQAVAIEAQPGSGPKYKSEMKGLIYQGGEYNSKMGESAQEAGRMDDNMAEGQAAEQSTGQYPEYGQPSSAAPEVGPKGQPDVQQDYSISEGPSRVKILISIAILAIAIIVAAVFLGGKAHKPTTSTSTIPQKYTTSVGNQIIRSAANQSKIIISNLNILYNYTGPSTNNTTNQSCRTSTHSTVISYSAEFNSSAQSYLYTTFNTGPCMLVVTNISISTPGFKVISTSPATPDSIPPNSQLYMVLTYQMPATAYVGPISLKVNER